MRARRIVPDTAAPRRRVGRSAGSLNLESALVVALLVLVAAFTLFSLGDAIACLYEREAHQANRIGFWAMVPEVTAETAAGAADGGVTWDTEGTSADDAFTILRYREGSGMDPEDHATWDDLGTYSAAGRPVTGLPVAAGDTVAIAVNVERCGYGLISPSWPGVDPGPEDPPDPADEGPGWYVGLFSVMDDMGTWTNETQYLAAFEPDGTQIWTIPLDVEGVPTTAWGPVAVSEDAFFLYLRPADGTEGIYAYPDWNRPEGPGEPELVLAGPVLVLDDGTSLTLNGYSLESSRDGSRLLLATADGRHRRRVRRGQPGRRDGRPRRDAPR